MTAWLGLCNECGQSKVFESERERDLWERFHSHNQEYSNA